MFLILPGDPAASKKRKYLSSYMLLSSVRPHVMNEMMERLRATIKRVKRKRRNNVSQLANAQSMQRTPHAVRAHELSSIQQGQALLGFEMNGLPFQLLENFFSSIDFVEVMHFTFSKQRKRKMSKRSKVARSSKRSHLVNARQHTHVEHFDKPFYCLQLN